MEDFVAGKNARPSLALNGFSNDAVAVVIIEDKNKIVAGIGGNDKSSGLVCVDLTR